MTPADELRARLDGGDVYLGTEQTCTVPVRVLEAVLADVERAREILTAIIYASDGCVGHKDCNHSIKPWKGARAFLGLLRDGEVVPPE